MVIPNKEAPQTTFEAKDLGKGDQCTWLIQADTDAPVFHIDAATDETAYEISYFHYDSDSS